jgi:hypothetical protein
VIHLAIDQSQGSNKLRQYIRYLNLVFASVMSKDKLQDINLVSLHYVMKNKVPLNRYFILVQKNSR